MIGSGYRLLAPCRSCRSLSGDPMALPKCFSPPPRRLQACRILKRGDAPCAGAPVRETIAATALLCADARSNWIIFGSFETVVVSAREEARMRHGPGPACRADHQDVRRHARAIAGWRALRARPATRCGTSVDARAGSSGGSSACDHDAAGKAAGHGWL